MEIDDSTTQQHHVASIHKFNHGSEAARTTTADDATVTTEQQPLPFVLPSDAFLQSMVAVGDNDNNHISSETASSASASSARVSSSSSSWHKQLLLGLFLQTDATGLKRLAAQETAGTSRTTTANISLAAVLHRQKKQRRKLQATPTTTLRAAFQTSSRTSEDGNEQDSPSWSRRPSLLSLVPLALQDATLTTTTGTSCKRPSSPSWMMEPATATASSTDDESDYTPSIAMTATTTLPNRSSNYSNKRPRTQATTPVVLESSSIAHVEDMVQRQFEKSKLGKQAIMTAAVAATQSPLRTTAVAAAQSPPEEAAERSTLFVPFSLAYNECSMASIASWATKNENHDFAHEPQYDYCPAPAVLFRKCTLCNKWGHYDSQCPILLGSSCSTVPDNTENNNQSTASVSSALMQVCRQVELQQALQQDHQGDGKQRSSSRRRALLSANIYPIGKNPSARENDNDDDDSDVCSDVSSVIDLEGWDGFVLEQVKSGAAEGVTGCGGAAADIDEQANGCSCVIGRLGEARRAKTFSSHNDYSVDDDDDDDYDYGHSEQDIMWDMETADGRGNNTLDAGDLCWMRQNCGNDDAPLSERDDWWPSIVLSINHGERNGPCFLVRRFALTSPRTRAHVLLPFLKYFEELGYNRVYGHHPLSRSHDSSLFVKALNLAVENAGLLSLSHALRQAREISGTSSIEGLHFLQETDVRFETWDQADDAVQDGILIRAKRDPLIDCGSGTKKPMSRLTGSVVAWFPHGRDSTTEHGVNSMIVGIVLAANLGDDTALVRPIRNWQEALSDVSRKGSFSVHSCLVGASTWKNMNELHMISSGAPLAVQTKFSQDVLPKMLNNERERLRRSYRDVQTTGDSPSTAKASIRKESKAVFDNQDLGRDDLSSQDGDTTAGISESESKRSPVVSSLRESVETASLQQAESIGVESVEARDGLLHMELSGDALLTECHAPQVSNDVTRSTAQVDDAPIGLLDNEAEGGNRREEIARGSITIIEETASVDAPPQSRKEVECTSDRHESEQADSPQERDASANCSSASIRLKYQRAWRFCDQEKVPPIHWMRILLERLRGISTSSQTDNAVKTMFKRKLHPSDVVYLSDTNEWELTGEGRRQSLQLLPADRTSAADETERCNEPGANATADTEKQLSSDIRQGQECASDSAKWTASTRTDDMANDDTREIPAALVRSSEPNDETTDDAQQREGDETADSHGNADPAEETSAKTYAWSENERAWQMVSADDMPPLYRMRELLQSNFSDDSSKSQTDSAVRARFRGRFHPTDFIQRAVSDSARNGALVSGDRDHESPPTGGEDVAAEDGEAGDMKRAAAVAAGPSAMGPAECAKLRREGGKLQLFELDTATSRQFVQNEETSSTHSSMSEGSASEAMDPEVRKLWEKGVYELEAILDDRQMMAGSRLRPEYLIKWKGFGMDDCTWEPKKNIWDAHVVEKYEVDKFYGKLKARLEDDDVASKQPSSSLLDDTTQRALEALSVGKRVLSSKLDGRQAASPAKDPPRRQSAISRRECPFCRKTFKHLISHLPVHSSANNFDLLKDAALVIREEWYE